MKLITRQYNASIAAKEWEKTYKKWDCEEKKETLSNLKKLGDNPNPDDVDRIIGNGTWTENQLCDECGNEKDTVEFLENDAYAVWICKECLMKALKLFE